MTLEKIKEINDLTKTWVELRRIIEDIEMYPFKYSSPKNVLMSKYNCISEDILDIIHGIAEEFKKEIVGDKQ